MSSGRRLATVTPDVDDVARYADASGDRNPIHLDADFARRVGLPGIVVHGMWTMAQVARAATARAGGDPRAIRELQVDFRAPGVPGKPIEVVLTGESQDTLELVVRQGSRRLVRHAVATVLTTNHYLPTGGSRVAATRPEQRN